MDVKGFNRPKKKPQTAKPPEKEVTTQSNNLHKTPRGQRVAREFKLSQETSMDFDIMAAERGYNKRQGSEFFEEVWKFWKSHNKTG